MIDLNSETVQQIIDKAREFQVHEEIVVPDQDDTSDGPSDTFGVSGEDPAFQQLKTAIDDLGPDQQVALVALMWVGRGDFGAGEWPAAVQRARDSWTPRTAEYLIGTPLLADYLAIGLDQLGQEVD